MNPNNDQFQEKFEEILKNIKNAEGREFVVLLIGRTGVGKSSTINNLMGEKVAPVNPYEPETMTIEKYKSQLNGVPYTIIDTPGLCDGFDEKNNYDYLEMMRSNIDRIDCIWFVTILGETRIRSDEKQGVKLISQCFGEKFWQQSVIVFTFADNVRPEQFSDVLEKRTRLIRKLIAEYIGDSTANNIPAVSVSNVLSTTPDGQEWLGELFTQTFLRISSEGVLPFLFSILDEIRMPDPINASPEFRGMVDNLQRIQKQLKREKKKRKKAEKNLKKEEDGINDDPDFSNSDEILEPRFRLSEGQAKKVATRANRRMGTSKVDNAATGAATGAAIGAAIGGLPGAAIGAAAGLFIALAQNEEEDEED